MNDIMKVYETKIKEKEAKHTGKKTDKFFPTLFTVASLPTTITKWQIRYGAFSDCDRSRDGQRHISHLLIFV